MEEAVRPAPGDSRACIRCGFCLEACPTYRETHEEGHSARGRLLLLEEGHCLRDHALHACGAGAPQAGQEGMAATSLLTLVGMVVADPEAMTTSIERPGGVVAEQSWGPSG